MKVIFLDIDGVLNSEETVKKGIRSDRGYIGIDPFLTAIFNRIIFATDAKIVLSSTWRKLDTSRDEVRRRVMDFIDVTPDTFLMGESAWSERGDEIQAWLDHHPEVEKYAIIDDDNRAMEQHGDNYFQTFWNEGLTEGIAATIIQHLNNEI